MLLDLLNNVFSSTVYSAVAFYYWDKQWTDNKQK